MKKTTLVAVIIPVLIGFSWFFWAQNESVTNPDFAELKALNLKQFEQPVTASETQVEKPTSLQGVEFAAELKSNEDQTLIPTYSLRELFEHYLSTYGEQDLEQVIALIQADIVKKLEEPARSEALALLKRYIDYKIALAEDNPVSVINQDESLSYLEKIIAAKMNLQAFREQFFSTQEYEAFFAQEDAQNEYMIEQLRINTDPNLDPQEKSALLEQAKQLLPEDVRISRERVQQHADLRERVKELRANGASESEVYQAREAEFGSEAASALAELDEQRKVWQQRLQVFAERRSAILDSGLSESDKTKSVNELLVAQFDDTERKRVSALMNDGRLN